MPFKSEAQRRFLWARHPEVARKWADKYGTPNNLPVHESKSESGISRKLRAKRKAKR